MTGNLIARIITTAVVAGIISLGAGAAHASAEQADVMAGPGVSDPWDSAPVDAPMSDPWD